MKKIFFVGWLIACLVCGSLVSSAQKVVVYGIVYNTVCNSQSYYFHTYNLVDINDVPAAKKQLEEILANEYPGKKNRVGSSNFDCGPNCNYACIYSYDKKKPNGCSITVLSFVFGKSWDSVFEKAQNNTNLWSDGQGKMRVVDKFSW